MSKTIEAVGAVLGVYTFAGGMTMAETINFDADAGGVAPAGWTAGVPVAALIAGQSNPMPARRRKAMY